jgi:hypothetical protein
MLERLQRKGIEGRDPTCFGQEASRKWLAETGIKE